MANDNSDLRILFWTGAICATIVGYGFFNNGKTQSSRTVDSVVSKEVVENTPVEVVEMPWKKYELANMPEYNSLLPVMYKESERTGVSLEQLAVICLTESRGKGGERYEAGFQKRYINPLFDGPETNDNRRYRNFFKSINEKTGVSLDDFKKQLSTSTGPMQIMYATAFDRGFRGTFEELSKSKTCIAWASNYLQSKGVTSETKMEDVLKIFNTGSINGKPHLGHLDRAKEWCAKLGVRYE